MDLPSELDLAPAPTDSNLANLSDVLSAIGPKLRAFEQRRLPITLHPDVIRAIPLLPLTTELGDVNLVMHPAGAPDDYAELLEESSTVELDGIPTVLPIVDALLRGLAGGAREPHPELVARLRQAAKMAPSDYEAGLPSPSDLIEQRDVEQAILETVERLGHPATIRELLVAMNTRGRLKYKHVKRAAESLTTGGQLARKKHGTAYRYMSNTDNDDQIVYEVAALLSKSSDIEATITRARTLATSDALPPE